MKNVVFDTSVAIKWFFPEKGKNKADDLKSSHLQGKISLCTRELFLYEFTSALKNYKLVRIEEKDFLLAISALRFLKLKIYPLEYDELKELFSISHKLQISIYDASFLSLAKKLKAPLYTADKKLYQKGETFVHTFFV
ncbi:MAG: type II toxin-antitoxin system VapC family toxin [Microgenomates group bacterium]